MLGDAPQSLRHLEFVCIHFELEFQETTRLPAGAFLRLRRELLHVARFFDDCRDDGCAALFEPPLPNDPAARKRIQKPGPGFVIRGVPVTERAFEIGDGFELTVHFWGKAINRLTDFAGILEMLGRTGLSHGRGLFEIASIEAEDASGQRHLLRRCDGQENLAPPLLDVHWFLENAAPLSSPTLEMQFVTPARLLSRGTPLFKPTFQSVFPFILRRVTSMALAHCDLEPIGEPAELFALAARVEETVNTLQWTDWRRLEGKSRSQDLGGITGRLRLEGEATQELAWLLRLGSLLQIGKGAAYGAGRYDLVAPS